MEQSYSILVEQISRLSIWAVFISSILLIILSFFSLTLKHPGPNLKKILFLSFVAVVVGCTLVLAGSTIYLNIVSFSKGPVHHHADFQIYRCNEELDLKDPSGLSNKIGTPTIHEHNDKRIHIEGVIVKQQDASLANFFRLAGGNFENGALSFPTAGGQTPLKSGDSCPDTQNAQLQVFLYKVQGEIYTQTKLEDPKSYTVSPKKQHSTW